jgi:hypothetical protein
MGREAMFAAVRDRYYSLRQVFAAPATRRRMRRLSGLFVFEFVVVLLGVLAAQMLQENFADARARRDAKATVERARQEAAGFRSTSEYWLAAGPCLEAKMDEVMRAAAEGVDRSELHGPRPRIPLSALTPWSESTMNAARQTYGDEAVAVYFALHTMATKMADDSHELAGDRALLGLADPRFGPVSREDRMNTRIAAGRIKGRLASLGVTARYGVLSAERLAIPADPERKRLLTLPAGCSGGRR